MLAKRKEGKKDGARVGKLMPGVNCVKRGPLEKSDGVEV